MIPCLHLAGACSLRSMRTLWMAAFFSILLSDSAGAQNGLLWSDPVQVADPAFGKLSPRMALLPGDRPLVIWGNFNNNFEVWMARYDQGGFTTPVKLPTPGLSLAIFDFGGIDLAVYGDTVYIIVEVIANGMWVLRSDDQGQSFHPPVNITNPAQTGLSTTLPNLAVDASGRLYAAFIQSQSDESQARQAVCRSDDGGQTFTPLATANLPADGDVVCECCIGDFLTAGDTTWYAFRNNNANLRDMWVSRSLDAGQSFTEALDVDATDWTVNVCPFSGPKLARLSGDSILAVFMSKASGILRLYGSTFHGATMEKGQEFDFPFAAGASGTQNRPAIAGNLDTVIVAWEENMLTSTGQDIHVAFSTTGTSGLAGNTANITPAVGSQRFPELAYRNGVLHLVYVDGASARLKYMSASVQAPSAVAGPANIRNTLRIVPDPAGGQLHLFEMPESARAENLRLFNSSGRFMGQWVVPAGTKTLSLPVGELPRGIYILEWMGTGTRFAW